MDFLDLTIRQHELEQEMTENGKRQFEKAIEKAQLKGRMANTNAGRKLIQSHIEKVAEGIRKYATTKMAKAGRRAKFAKYLDGISADTVAYLGMKAIVDCMTMAKPMNILTLHIGQMVEDEVRFRDVRKENKLLYEQLVSLAAKSVRYSNKSRKFQMIAEKYEVEMPDWPTNARVGVGSAVLDIILQETQLFEIHKERVDGKNKGWKYYVRPKAEVVDWANERNAYMALLQPQYEPMVVPPQKWTGVRGGGYLTKFVRPLTLVKTSFKGYVEELRHTQIPMVHKALNLMQETAWAVRTPILEIMEDMWERSLDWTPFPPRFRNVQVPCPHCHQTFDSKAKAHPCFNKENPNYDPEKHKLWRWETRKSYERENQMQSKRLQLQKCLNTARKFSEYPAIYFPYQLDFRGRAYAVPAFNPQGPDYMKALLQFTEGKPLGEAGVKWLAIHGANTAGVDKASFQDRVNWVFANEEQIIAIANDPYSNRGWVEGFWKSAEGADPEAMEIDSPWQFLSFCLEWAGYVREGESFVSHLPIFMDGSCSGIQHYSMAFADEIGGAAVNLIPHDKPQDIYQRVADEVLKMIREDAAGSGKRKTLADEWLVFGVNRKTVKRSVMTYPYGSDTYGFREQLMEDIMKPAKMEKKNFPFDGTGFVAAGYMAEKIKAALPRVVVKAAEGMDWLKAAAGLLASDNLPVFWHTPDNFLVLQACKKVTLSHQVKTVIMGKMYKSHYNRELANIDRMRQRNGISPNFIHSLDGCHLRLTVVRANDVGLTNFGLVHDSFGTLAADTDTLYAVVREAMVEMYQTVDVFGDFREEVLEQLPEKQHEKLPELPSKGKLDLSGVLNSYYAFA